MRHTSAEQERAEFKLMRESFEKEIEKDYHKPREFGILNTIGDHYTNQHIEVAWDMWKRSWQASRRAKVVPQGWELVPINPTEEMLQAAYKSDVEYSTRVFGGSVHIPQSGEDHWSVMIASTPNLP